MLAIYFRDISLFLSFTLDISDIQAIWLGLFPTLHNVFFESGSDDTHGVDITDIGHVDGLRCY